MVCDSDSTDDSCDTSLKPRLRPVEVHPLDEPGSDGPVILVRDPSGLAHASLSVSMAALHVLSLLDGEHSVHDIQADLARRFGHAPAPDTLHQLIAHLEQHHFLEGPAFETHYGQLVSEYLAAPTRRMRDLASLGLEPASLRRDLEAMFAWPADGQARVSPAGLIAPHLDYVRGQPCYQEAYSQLAGISDIDRFVLLGTNHFGRSTAVVATSRAFETALGVVPVDLPFLEQIESRCGGSLRQFELDHQREHSVELQVLLLQHLLGHSNFSIVPILCPSPCGPTGTAPYDGRGVDLHDFGLALGERLATADRRTVLIAGADLSHVGEYFGDSRPLSPEFLEEVARRDQAALEQVSANSAEGFRACVSADDNPTRVCSAGCIYALLTALSHSTVRVIKYHQAVNQNAQCCVTCAAAVLVSN